MSAPSSARHVEKDAPSNYAVARIAYRLLDQYPCDRANARHRAVADTMKRFGLDGADTYQSILSMVYRFETQGETPPTEEVRQTAPVRKHRSAPARWTGPMTPRKQVRPGFVARVHDHLAAAEEAAPVIMVLKEPEPQPPQAQAPAEAPKPGKAVQMDLPLP